MGEQPQWMALADAVEALMQKRTGWKVANVAAAAGVYPNTITKLLNRDYSPTRGPDAATVRAVLSAFRPEDAHLLREVGLEEWADQVENPNGTTNASAQRIREYVDELAEILVEVTGDDDTRQRFTEKVRELRHKMGFE